MVAYGPSRVLIVIRALRYPRADEKWATVLQCASSWELGPARVIWRPRPPISVASFSGDRAAFHVKRCTLTAGNA